MHSVGIKKLMTIRMHGMENFVIKIDKSICIYTDGLIFITGLFLIVLHGAHLLHKAIYAPYIYGTVHHLYS